MIFKKHKDRVKCPPMSQLLDAFIRDGCHYKVLLVRSADMVLMKAKRPEEVFGRPFYLAEIDDMLVVYPTPDEDTDIRIQYAPPIVEA